MTASGGDRRAWLAGALLLVATLTAAALPSIGIVRAFAGDAGAPVEVSWTREAMLLTRTLGVAALIGSLAALLAIAPGWLMRTLPARWTALLLCPVLLPAYASHAAWGLLRAPGSWLASVIASDPARLAPLANGAQAVVGLALWSWPTAAIVIGAGARRIDASALDAARLHGRAAVLRLSLRALAPSIVAGAGLVALVMLGSAVPLHLAQIETSAISVWRRLDETAGARAAWLAAAPLMTISLLAGVALALWLARSMDARSSDRVTPAPARTSRLALLATALIWTASTLAPLALFLGHLREARSIPAVASSIAPALGHSAAIAAAVGAAVALIGAITSLACSLPGARSPRLFAAAIWLVLALMPGVLVGAAIARAGAIPSLRPLVESSGAIALAHIARFGALGLIAGVALAHLEPRELRDLRRIEPRPAMAWLRAALPIQAPALLGAGIAAGALSLHEIEAAVMLTPPGSQTLSQRMLGMLHYLRVEELNAAASIVLLLSLTLALASSALASISIRRLARLAPLALLLILLPACDRAAPTDGADIRPIAIFGEVGTQPGQFVYPRCLDADDHSLWLIDKKGHVQRLSTDGHPLASWTMPETSNGFPTGITVDPRNADTVYIADTHCHRVMVYRVNDGEPTLVRQWGAFGEEPGRFIYLTDIAVVDLPDGSRRFYVTEYGGNDRVSCFDEDANFLFAFGDGEGSSATADRIEFQRPQSIAWHDALQRLIVADAGNHRLGLFTLDGALDRWIGRVDSALGPMPGDGEGEFNYPYGLDILPDGSILVSEFGASRVQRLDPATGRRLGAWGRPGREPGRLACPWGVASIGDIAYVLDSANHRVVAFDSTHRGAGGTAQRP